MSLRPAHTRGASALGVIIGIFAILLAVILGLAFANQQQAQGGQGVVGDRSAAPASEPAASSTPDAMSAAEAAHAGISTSAADAMAAHGTDNGPQMEDGVIPADDMDGMSQEQMESMDASSSDQVTSQ